MVNVAPKPASQSASILAASQSSAASADSQSVVAPSRLTEPSWWQQLADQALAGEVLTRQAALAVLQAPDDVILDQLAAVYRARRHYWSNRVRLHFLLNAQSGLCPEDCHYCSQSKISGADIEKYPLMAKQSILAAAERAHEMKAGTFGSG